MIYRQHWDRLVSRSYETTMRRQHQTSTTTTTIKPTGYSTKKQIVSTQREIIRDGEDTDACIITCTCKVRIQVHIQECICTFIDVQTRQKQMRSVTFRTYFSAQVCRSPQVQWKLVFIVLVLNSDSETCSAIATCISA